MPKEQRVNGTLLLVWIKPLWYSKLFLLPRIENKNKGSLCRLQNITAVWHFCFLIKSIRRLAQTTFQQISSNIWHASTKKSFQTRTETLLFLQYPLNVGSKGSLSGYKQANSLMYCFAEADVERFIDSRVMFEVSWRWRTMGTCEGI